MKFAKLVFGSDGYRASAGIANAQFAMPWAAHSRPCRSENDLYKTKLPRILLASALAILIAGHANADRGDRDDRGGNAREQQSLISRDRAAAVARSATGGRVLDVRLERGGRPTYRVKMLLDGNRVRSIGVDARSGAIRK